MSEQIILTALNGLRSVEASEIAGLKEVIAQLQARDIPVIVYTQCDRAEVEPVRSQLGLSAPFITESGSGIFTPVSHNPFDPPLGEKDGDYYVEMLGCPYVQVRAGLRVLANVISHPLKGYGDFTVAQLQRSAQTSEEAAHRAKAREFSEPFMTPKAVDAKTLCAAAEEMGFGMVVRSDEAGRFSELVGPGAGLRPSAQTIVAAYQKCLSARERLKVMGISDRAEDLSLLAKASELVDWTGVLIPPGASAAKGWLSAVAPLLA